MKISCTCGFSGNVPDTYIGKNVKCRQCGSAIPVPELAAAVQVDKPTFWSTRNTLLVVCGAVLIGCSGIATICTVALLYRSPSATGANASQGHERIIKDYIADNTQGRTITEIILYKTNDDGQIFYNVNYTAKDRFGVKVAFQDYVCVFNGKVNHWHNEQTGQIYNDWKNQPQKVKDAMTNRQN